MPATIPHAPDVPSNALPALVPILRELASGGRSPELLERIASETRAATQAESVAIAFRSDGGDLLDIAAVSGEDPRTLVGMQIRAESSFAERVLRTGRTTVHFAGETETHSAPQPGWPAGIRSACVAPVRCGADICGALFALNKAGGEPFAGSDVETIEAMATCAGLAARLEDRERFAARKSSESETLLKAARAISGSLSLPEVLAAALDALCNRLSHRAAAIFLMNDEGTHLFIAADRGLTAEEREAQLSPESSAVAKVLTAEAPLLVSDLASEHTFADIVTLSRIRSLIAAPIPGRDGALGLLVVASLQPHAYSPEDANLAQAVAAQAGAAIQNAFLFEEAVRNAQESSALYDHSQRMSESLDLKCVCAVTSESIQSSLKADQAAVLLRDGDRLVLAASRGIDSASRERMRFRIGQGVPGWVCQWMTPTAVADLTADSRDRLAPIPCAHSAICAPIGSGSEALGVVLALSRRRRLFTIAEMEMLYTLANQAAVAISNARLYQEARAKSVRMRRYFQRIARALGAAVAAKGDPNLLSELACEMLSADRCVIYRLRKDASLARFAGGGGRTASTPGEDLAPGTGFAGAAARTGKSVVVTDVASDARSKEVAWLARDRMASCVAVPVASNGEVVGVVEVYSQAPRVFSKADLKLVRLFIRESGLASR